MGSSAIHPALLGGYGLVAAGIDTVADRFGTHDRADQSKVRVVGRATDAEEAIRHLFRRTIPATALVLVDLND